MMGLAVLEIVLLVMAVLVVGTHVAGVTFVLSRVIFSRTGSRTFTPQ